MSETGENSDEGNHAFVSCFDLFFFLFNSSSPDQKLLLGKILYLLKVTNSALDSALYGNPC